MFRPNPFEFLLNLLQKCSTGTSFWKVNAFLNLVCHCDVADDKRFVVRKRFPWKIFEQIVTIACFKSKPLDAFCKRSALKILANFTGKYLYWRIFLINLQACGPEAFLKSHSNTCIFPVKFAKFWRAPSVKTICKPLLLYLQMILFTMHEKDVANEA